MPHRLLLAELAVPLKVGIAALVGLYAVLADSVGEVSGAERWTVPALLVAALGYLARQLSQEKAEHKAEMEAKERAYKEELEERCRAASDREGKMTAALTATAEALAALRASTDLQTGYFKTIGQTLINRQIGKPNLPQDSQST